MNYFTPGHGWDSFTDIRLSFQCTIIRGFFFFGMLIRVLGGLRSYINPWGSLWSKGAKQSTSSSVYRCFFISGTMSVVRNSCHCRPCYIVHNKPFNFLSKVAKYMFLCLWLTLILFDWTRWGPGLPRLIERQFSYCCHPWLESDTTRNWIKHVTDTLKLSP